MFLFVACLEIQIIGQLVYLETHIFKLNKWMFGVRQFLKKIRLSVVVCQLNKFPIKNEKKKRFTYAILKDKGFKRKKIMIKNQVLQINK